MKVFGFEISRQKAAVPVTTIPSGWWEAIKESFPGAWQRNVELRLDNVLTYSAVYSCSTLISSDIGKMGLRLVRPQGDIWVETENPKYSPVLKKPNHYQTRIKFIEQWVLSKLIYGNTYVLKERAADKTVVRLYILDPRRVKVLVADDGSVYYDLGEDKLSGIPGQRIGVPASEIIHDINAAFYHPLCGISPISACGLAATQGLYIQNNSAKFFQGGSRPGGIIYAPGPITNDQARALKEHWEQNYSGANMGKTAVLGDGLKFEAVTITNEDSQLIEQLKWTAETVCTAFHVPPFMIGVGEAPSYDNVEALLQLYYSQCLQIHIESIELLLDEGLGLTELGKELGTEFDLNDLLRMDTSSKVKSWGDLVKAGIASPNEARTNFSLGPVDGGDTPYLQQQNYSLAALDKRDTGPDPFGKAKPEPAAAELSKPVADSDDDEATPQEQASALIAVLKQELVDARYDIH